MSTLTRAMAILVILNATLHASAQTNQWTWKGGATHVPNYGVYGTKGIANGVNQPGARQEETTWKDASGNYWIFGGNGNARAGTGYMSDLWKYDVATNNWTWMSGGSETGAVSTYGAAGVSDAASLPGARSGALSWVDTNGDLWLFGGYNGTNAYNELWKYTISTGLWTWFKGGSAAKAGNYGTKGTSASTNMPGGRHRSASWTDASGNLWLYGGTGYPYNISVTTTLNDVWKYNISTGEWTWISGENTGNSAGVYGTIGVSAGTNKPGARYGSAFATDASGNFWMFGGYGTAVSSSGILNDLWKYNITTNEWTWISGPTAANSSAAYGAKGASATTYRPGSKYGAKAAFDASGNLWIYGGNGLASGPYTGNVSDLWKFNPGTTEWTWVSGDNIYNTGGTYGPKGVASTSYAPGARQYSAFFSDASNNLYVMGGYGYLLTNMGYLNLSDVWKYSIGSNTWAWIHGDRSLALLSSGAKGIASPSNSPAGRSGAAVWKDASGDIWVFGGTGMGPDLVNNSFNDLWKYSKATGQWIWLSGDSITNVNGVYGVKGTGSATTKPGARTYANYWTDAAGNFWLFGGNGYGATGTTAGYLNDLWKYDPSSNTWTWVNGDNATNQFGVYGTKGTPDAANKPGGRYMPSSWQDDAGDIWLFGGNAYGASGYAGHINDLWKYNIATNQWTWVNGPNAVGGRSVHGQLGVSSPASIPCGRQAGASWKGKNGELWMYAGFSTVWPVGGYNSFGQDFWKYTIATNEWTWMGGDTTGTNKRGKYGTQGVGATTNLPGSNAYSATFTDTAGNLWLFGGTGYDKGTGTQGQLSDWWVYTPANANWTWIRGNGTIGNSSTYGVQGTADAANTPGARDLAAVWIDTDNQINIFGGRGVAANVSGNLNDMWTFKAVAPGSPLPVKLSGLAAEWVDDNVVMLSWKSAMEQNSKEYIIERSATGVSYAAVAAVAAHGYASAYSFRDEQPMTKNYYRLKMVDLDGRMEYSGVVVLSKTGDATGCKLLSNPVRDVMQLQVNTASAATLAVQVVSQSGRVVYSGARTVSAGASLLSVPASQWSAGYYVVKVSGGGVEKTIGFIIVK